jgi:hypothetical protein
MNKAAAPPRWYAPWRAEPRVEQDAADLGTAFGLDLSLDEGASALDAPAPRAAGRRWMPRWRTAGKPVL